MKFRRYFFAWTFPYHFLAPSPLATWLPFLKNYQPKFFVKFIGFCGGFVVETAVGLLLAFGPSTEWRFLAMLGATGMHVFIFFFGIGPYRWNVYHCFMGWSSWWLTSLSPDLSDSSLCDYWWRVLWR